MLTAEYMDHMGDDLTVVNIAKVSFAKASSELGEAERRLIGFLARGATVEDWEKIVYRIVDAVEFDEVERIVRGARKMATHWTPFAHPTITLRMAAPVPIRTQCFKHKSGFVENEESRRYISGTPEVFLPTEWRLKPKGSIKQGSAERHPQSAEISEFVEAHYRSALDLYKRMIDDGVCPEQARFVLPQGTVVNWVWTGSLAAFARFYNQRSDGHAQQEIQDLAREVGEIIEPLFPVSWAALTS